MTTTNDDSQATPGMPRPRRAEPLQPDKPGSGTAPETPSSDRDPPGGDPDGERQRKQSDDALDNVREGYD